MRTYDKDELTFCAPTEAAALASISLVILELMHGRKLEGMSVIADKLELLASAMREYISTKEYEEEENILHFSPSCYPIEYALDRDWSDEQIDQEHERVYEETASTNRLAKFLEEEFRLADFQEHGHWRRTEYRDGRSERKMLGHFAVLKLIDGKYVHVPVSELLPEL